MKILVVGSEGYIGRALSCRLARRDDVHLYRVDPCVYGQHRHHTCKRLFKAKDITQYIDEVEPDHIVWLGAYAHDPQNRINVTTAIRNNARRPSVALSGTGCSYTAVSSLSVFAAGAYPESKRCLEQLLVSSGDFGQRGNILRFGTIFGAPGHGDGESFRPHLLLNRMSLDAVRRSTITVVDPNKKRPVLSLLGAVSALEASIFLEGPRGMITNVYDTCGTLRQFAEYVKERVEIKRALAGGGPAVLISVPDIGKDVDTRDYGWGKFDPQAIWFGINELITCAAGLDQTDKFPALYDFVKREEDGTL